jgi:asparagine synthase (glutamine-hydrolysing)|tara:strand:+ start:7045 stop:8895 length:1851 start_codon:yes stop_codon:yes gene_type:complete
MCGICGITWSDQQLIRSMGNEIKHRGPEQEGFFIDNEISLCCERLKILDLSENAKQPLHNEDNTIWVVLNGEIYNFKEIKNELEKNHTFYTNADTEVIVHAYEEYGEDCVHKLNGMFSFAIWDSKKKKLFIARDRLGVKPLFYSIVKNNLLFSSEIKSILQFDGVTREINHDGLYQFATYGYTIDGQTMMKNIYELLPGHKLIYSFLDNSIKIEKYWELEIKESNFAEDFYIKKLEKILTNSIDLRQVSDAPIGALLSGGLDSSIMVAILSKLSEQPVKTFTTGFGHELDEYSEAQTVAEHCGTDHKEISLTFDHLSKSLPTILWHMEFPFGRPSILSNYLVSEQVKKFVTVAYTGEGSDELFGGYNRYLIYSKDKSNVPLDQKLNSISSGFFDDISGNNIFSDGVMSFKNSQNHQKHQFKKIIDNNKSSSSLNQALLYELKTEIPGAQTWRIDRCGYAHAVEMREPFLDYNLAEFSLTIPSHFKINNIDGINKKYILQKLGKKYLPEKIAKRKKFPWGIPFYDFFRKEFSSIVECAIDKSFKEKRPYLKNSSAYSKNLFKNIISNNSGKINNKEIEINDRNLRQLLFLFNLELWTQMFIESDDVSNLNLSLNNFI